MDTSTASKAAILTAQPLTADDLTAAKRADEVSLHLHKGGSFIRLYTRGHGDPAIYTATQQRLYADDTNFSDRRARELHVSASAIGYGDDDGNTGWRWNSNDGWMSGEQVDPPQCFYSVYNRDVWGTIVAALRIGDTLRLEWVADNNSDNSRKAGLHVDEVRLWACREQQRTSKALTRTWHLGWSVGPDNSARMVRRYGW